MDKQNPTQAMNNQDKPATPYRHGDVVIDKGDRYRCPRMVCLDKDKAPIPLHFYNETDRFPYISEREVIDKGDRLFLADNMRISDWNKEDLHDICLHYSLRDRKMKRWFQPYDRVLVRNWDDQPWRCDIFSHYDTGGPFAEPYKCIGGCWAQCIPYITHDEQDFIHTTEGYVNTKITPEDFTQL